MINGMEYYIFIGKKTVYSYEKGLFTIQNIPSGCEESRPADEMMLSGDKYCIISAPELNRTAEYNWINSI